MIFVDGLMDTRDSGTVHWPYAQSCHMESDLSDREKNLAELVAFAARLGLQPSWLQIGRLFGHVHYHFDLTAGRRAHAVKLGARQLTTRQAAVLRTQLYGPTSIQEKQDRKAVP